MKQNKYVYVYIYIYCASVCWRLVDKGRDKKSWSNQMKYSIAYSSKFMLQILLRFCVKILGKLWRVAMQFPLAMATPQPFHLGIVHYIMLFIPSIYWSPKIEMLETHVKKHGSKQTSKFHGATHQSIANNRSPQRRVATVSCAGFQINTASSSDLSIKH